MEYVFEGYIERTYDGWFLCETPDDIDPMAHGVDPFGTVDAGCNFLRNKRVKITVEILNS